MQESVPKYESLWSFSTLVSLDMLPGHGIFSREIYLLFCSKVNFTVFVFSAYVLCLVFGEYIYMTCIKLPSALVI